MCEHVWDGKKPETRRQLAHSFFGGGGKALFLLKFWEVWAAGLLTKVLEKKQLKWDLNVFSYLQVHLDYILIDWSLGHMTIIKYYIFKENTCFLDLAGVAQ